MSALFNGGGAVLAQQAATPPVAAGKERKILYWKSPMDPTFIARAPGKDPMGMDLVPVYEGEQATGPPGMVRIDPVTIQNIGVKTVVVERSELSREIRTVGRITYDEKRVRHIAEDRRLGRAAVRQLHRASRQQRRTAPRDLQPRARADVTLRSAVTREGLAVPVQAVIRTGKRNIVLVALDGGRFLPRDVRLGAEVGDQFEILDGLQAGERVVTSAQFLINSESSLQSAISKMLEPATSTAEQAQGAAPPTPMRSMAMPGVTPPQSSGAMPSRERQE